MGSGKTVATELVMLKVFEKYPGEKCVCITPLKALVRERIADWHQRIELGLGSKCIYVWEWQSVKRMLSCTLQFFVVKLLP